MTSSDFMKDSEARDWLARFRKKSLEEGKGEALSWWDKTVSDIERIRGKQAADDLRRRMNEQRVKKK